MTDRELDALLAEHLFGLKDVGLRKDEIGAAITGRPEKELFHGPRSREPMDMAMGPPGLLVHHYSTTGDGMLMVIQEMGLRHGWKGHNGFTLTRDGAWFYCEFPSPKWEYAESDTAPRAVALAALKALGIEVPE